MKFFICTSVLLFLVNFGIAQIDHPQNDLVDSLSGRVWRSEVTPWELNAKKKYYSIEITKEGKLLFYDAAAKKLEFSLQSKFSNDSILLYKQKNVHTADGFLILKLSDSSLNVSFQSKNMDCCAEKSWAYFEKITNSQNVFKFIDTSCCTNHNPKHCADNLEEMAKFTKEKNCIF